MVKTNPLTKNLQSLLAKLRLMFVMFCRKSASSMLMNHSPVSRQASGSRVMSMTEPSIYHSTQDKLLVFVSSRLEECKEERLIVRNEIVALNHEPVLFEHVGARAYSARSFYLSRLRKSQVMVAIYRAGYGYVDSANGMQISGVEDEFRNATSWGIPTLCYVHRLSDRDPRLQTIVDDAEKRFKVCFYDNPDELGRRVRDDLTAFITERVLIASAPIGALLETSANILAQVLKRAGVVVNRSALVEDLKALTAVEAIACLDRPAGPGKTTLAA